MSTNQPENENQSEVDIAFPYQLFMNIMYCMMRTVISLVVCVILEDIETKTIKKIRVILRT